MGRQWSVGEPERWRLRFCDHFDTGFEGGVVLVASGRQWLMGQQWQVGEPKGGGFGSSDHLGTPVAPEEWFWLSGVKRGGWVGNGRLVSQKGGVAISAVMSLVLHQSYRPGMPWSFLVTRSCELRVAMEAEVVQRFPR